MTLIQPWWPDPSGDAAVLTRPQPVIALAAVGSDRFAALTADGAVDVFRVDVAPSFLHLPWRPKLSTEALGRVAWHPAASALAVAHVDGDVLIATADHAGRLDVAVVGGAPATTVELGPLPGGGPTARRLVAVAGTDVGAQAIVAAGRHLTAVAVALPTRPAGPELHPGAAHEHPRDITAVEVVAADGSALLVVGDVAGQVTVLDIGAEALITRWESTAALAPVRALQAWEGPAGEVLVAAAHADGLGTVWQVTRDGAGVEVVARTTISGLPTGPRTLAVGPTAPSARLLAAAGTSALKVWALGSDRHLTVEIEAVVAAALLRPADGDAVAVMASRDGEVVLRTLDGTSQWFKDATPGLADGRRPEAGDSLQVRAAADRPYTGDGEDHLEFGRYADALALLLENEHTGTPLTMAIDGPWGSGKTSLGRMTQRRLAREQPLATARRSSVVAPPPITCWFDAWTHDGGDRLSGALTSAIVNVLDVHRPWWQRLLHPIDGRLLNPASRRRRQLRLALLWPLATAVVLALAIAAVPGGLAGLERLLGVNVDGPTVLVVGGTSVSLALLRALPVALARAGATVAQYVRAPVSVEENGSVARVREELGQFIASATAARPAPAPAAASRVRRWWERRLDGIGRHKALAVTLGRVLALRPERRFVLFVDNLDRCRPVRAVEACETLSQIVDHDRVATVLMVDLHTLAIAAEVTYQDVAQRVFPAAGGQGWGRAFLEKLVQFDFTLPAPTPERVQAVFHANAGGGKGQQP